MIHLLCTNNDGENIDAMDMETIQVCPKETAQCYLCEIKRELYSDEMALEEMLCMSFQTVKFLIVSENGKYSEDEFF
jgi:hypothetical protein